MTDTVSQYTHLTFFRRIIHDFFRLAPCPQRFARLVKTADTPVKGPYPRKRVKQIGTCHHVPVNGIIKHLPRFFCRLFLCHLDFISRRTGNGNKRISGIKKNRAVSLVIMHPRQGSRFRQKTGRFFQTARLGKIRNNRSVQTDTADTEIQSAPPLIRRKNRTGQNNPVSEHMGIGVYRRLHFFTAEKFLFRKYLQIIPYGFLVFFPRQNKKTVLSVLRLYLLMIFRK